MTKKTDLNAVSSAEAKSLSLEDHNICFMFEDFDRKAVKPVIEFILKKNLMPDSVRPKHITLVINSPGGELDSAFSLIDIMKGSAIPVHTLGLGQISSCGLLTFMAGAKGNRVLTPLTSILSHQYSWGSIGKSHELFARVKEFELVNDRMMKLYKNCTGLSETKIKECLLPAEDVWLSAEEAVELGIADRIQSTW